MWNKLTEETPPLYKKLLIWVDNGPRIAIYQDSGDFFYPEGLDETKCPTHWQTITSPENNIKRVCF